MSRRHFQSLATALGLGLRWAQGTSAEAGYLAAVGDVCRDLDSLSTTFSSDMFMTWVSDVASGRRDATGAKVKPAKVSA